MWGWSVKIKLLLPYILTQAVRSDLTCQWCIFTSSLDKSKQIGVFDSGDPSELVKSLTCLSTLKGKVSWHLAAGSCWQSCNGVESLIDGILFLACDVVPFRPVPVFCRSETPLTRLLPIFIPHYNSRLQTATKETTRHTVFYPFGSTVWQLSNGEVCSVKEVRRPGKKCLVSRTTTVKFLADM